MTLQRRITWYLKRARVMTAAEVAQRIKDQLTLVSLAVEHGRLARPEGIALAFCHGAARQLPDLPFDMDEIRHNKDRLIAGHFPALGFDWQWHDQPDIWRRAPDSGRLWPARFFGSIPYRSGNAVGDVRVVWEPARLQQLVALALLAREPQVGAQALDMLERQLLSWVFCNAPWGGVHFVSAMECALRVISVCHSVDMVRDRLVRPGQVFDAASRVVSSHAGLIARRLSVHSSAGNHTIAECAGLIYAGILFPEWPEAKGWQRAGTDLLVAEFRRQVMDDGGGVEQAFWYLLFISDLVALVVALLRYHNVTVPSELLDRLDLSQGFLREFAHAPDSLPHIGDRDGGFALSSALRLSMHRRDGVKATKIFRDSGYSVARTPSDETMEVIFDHGPMGMPPSYGHAHADALAVTVRRRGNDVLVDSGTGTYNGNPDWRRYFRSTAAHNTVEIDGRDQAVQETAFQWTSPVRAELVRVDVSGGGYRGLAVHYGYQTARLGIRHWRGVRLTVRGEMIVWDYIDGTGQHEARWHWHCAGNIERCGSEWLLAEDMVMQLPVGTKATLLRGSSAPYCGWSSRTYGRTEVSATIRACAYVGAPAEFVTSVAPSGVAYSKNQIERESRIFRHWMMSA